MSHPVGPVRRVALNSTPRGEGPPGRLLSLDLLRGVAILLVLGRHTVAPIDQIGLLAPVARAWTRIGWSGVDLFFVLSGFLVSGLLFAEYKRAGTVDIKRFVIRRGFKIWPPYLVFVGFVACWLAFKQWRGDAGEGVWSQLWPNLFHVQNYFHTPRVHTWSLAVEEHFYLAVALGFYWLLSRGRASAALRAFPWFVTITVVLLAALRTFVLSREGPDSINLYATHLRFDGLLIGTLLAYLSHFRPHVLAPYVRHPFTLILVGVVLALPVYLFAPETNGWTVGPGLTAMYLGYALVLLGVLNLPAHSRAGARLFRTPPVAIIGSIGFFSYSIYLWHVDLAQTPLHKVALALASHGWSPGAVYLCCTAAYVLLAVVTGRVLARLLERPSIAVRDRLFPNAIKAVASPSR